MQFRRLQQYRRLFDEPDVAVFVHSALTFDGEDEFQIDLLLQESKSRLESVDRALFPKRGKSLLSLAKEHGWDFDGDELPGAARRDVSLPENAGSKTASSTQHHADADLVDLYRRVCDQAERFRVFQRIHSTSSASTSPSKLSPRGGAVLSARGDHVDVGVQTPTIRSKWLSWLEIRSLSDRELAERLARFSHLSVVVESANLLRELKLAIDSSPEKLQELCALTASVGVWEPFLKLLFFQQPGPREPSREALAFFLTLAIRMLEAKLLHRGKEWIRFCIGLSVGSSGPGAVTSSVLPAAATNSTPAALQNGTQPDSVGDAWDDDFDFDDDDVGPALGVHIPAPTVASTTAPRREQKLNFGAAALPSSTEDSGATATTEHSGQGLPPLPASCSLGLEMLYRLHELASDFQRCHSLFDSFEQYALLPEPERVLLTFLSPEQVRHKQAAAAAATGALVPLAGLAEGSGAAFQKAALKKRAPSDMHLLEDRRGEQYGEADAVSSAMHSLPDEENHEVQEQQKGESASTSAAATGSLDEVAFLDYCRRTLTLPSYLQQAAGARKVRPSHKDDFFFRNELAFPPRFHQHNPGAVRDPDASSVALPPSVAASRSRSPPRSPLTGTTSKEHHDAARTNNCKRVLLSRALLLNIDIEGREQHLVEALITKASETANKHSLQTMRNLTALVKASSLARAKEERIIKGGLNLMKLSLDAIYAARCPAVLILDLADQIYSQIPDPRKVPEMRGPEHADLHGLADLMEKHLNFVEHILCKSAGSTSNLTFGDLKNCQTDSRLCENTLFLLFRVIGNGAGRNNYRDANYWRQFAMVFLDNEQVFGGVSAKRKLQFLLQGVLDHGHFELVADLRRAWFGAVSQEEFRELLVAHAEGFLQQAAALNASGVHKAMRCVQMAETLAALDDEVSGAAGGRAAVGDVDVGGAAGASSRSPSHQGANAGSRGQDRDVNLSFTPTREQDHETSSSLIPNLAENLRRQQKIDASLSPALRSKLEQLKLWIRVCFSLHELLASKRAIADVFVEDVKATMAEVQEKVQERAADALKKIQISENFDKVKEKVKGGAGGLFGAARGLFGQLFEEEEEVNLSSALGHLRSKDTPEEKLPPPRQQEQVAQKTSSGTGEAGKEQQRPDYTSSGGTGNAAGGRKSSRKSKRGSRQGSSTSLDAVLGGRLLSSLEEDEFFEKNPWEFAIETPVHVRLLLEQEVTERKKIIAALAEHNPFLLVPPFEEKFLHLLELLGVDAFNDLDVLLSRSAVAVLTNSFAAALENLQRLSNKILNCDDTAKKNRACRLVLGFVASWRARCAAENDLERTKALSELTGDCLKICTSVELVREVATAYQELWKVGVGAELQNAAGSFAGQTVLSLLDQMGLAEEQESDEEADTAAALSTGVGLRAGVAKYGFRLSKPFSASRLYAGLGSDQLLNTEPSTMIDGTSKAQHEERRPPRTSRGSFRRDDTLSQLPSSSNRFSTTSDQRGLDVDPTSALSCSSSSRFEPKVCRSLLTRDSRMAQLYLASHGYDPAETLRTLVASRQTSLRTKWYLLQVVLAERGKSQSDVAGRVTDVLQESERAKRQRDAVRFLFKNVVLFGEDDEDEHEADADPWTKEPEADGFKVATTTADNANVYFPDFPGRVAKSASARGALFCLDRVLLRQERALPKPLLDELFSFLERLSVAREESLKTRLASLRTGTEHAIQKLEEHDLNYGGSSIDWWRADEPDSEAAVFASTASSGSAVASLSQYHDRDADAETRPRSHSSGLGKKRNGPEKTADDEWGWGNDDDDHWDDFLPRPGGGAVDDRPVGRKAEGTSSKGPLAKEHPPASSSSTAVVLTEPEAARAPAQPQAPAEQAPAQSQIASQDLGSAWAIEDDDLWNELAGDGAAFGTAEVAPDATIATSTRTDQPAPAAPPSPSSKRSKGSESISGWTDDAPAAVALAEPGGALKQPGSKQPGSARRATPAGASEQPSNHSQVAAPSRKADDAPDDGWGDWDEQSDALSPKSDVKSKTAGAPGSSTIPHIAAVSPKPASKEQDSAGADGWDWDDQSEVSALNGKPHSVAASSKKSVPPAAEVAPDEVKKVEVVNAHDDGWDWEDDDHEGGVAAALATSDFPVASGAASKGLLSSWDKAASKDSVGSGGRSAGKEPSKVSNGGSNLEQADWLEGFSQDIPPTSTAAGAAFVQDPSPAHLTSKDAPAVIDVIAKPSASPSWPEDVDEVAPTTTEAALPDVSSAVASNIAGDLSWMTDAALDLGGGLASLAGAAVSAVVDGAGGGGASASPSNLAAMELPWEIEDDTPAGALQIESADRIPEMPATRGLEAGGSTMSATATAPSPSHRGAGARNASPSLVNLDDLLNQTTLDFDRMPAMPGYDAASSSSEPVAAEKLQADKLNGQLESIEKSLAADVKEALSTGALPWEVEALEGARNGIGSARAGGPSGLGEVGAPGAGTELAAAPAVPDLPWDDIFEDDGGEPALPSTAINLNGGGEGGAPPSGDTSSSAGVPAEPSWQRRVSPRGVAGASVQPQLREMKLFEELTGPETSVQDDVVALAGNVTGFLGDNLGGFFGAVANAVAPALDGLTNVSPASHLLRQSDAGGDELSPAGQVQVDGALQAAVLKLSVLSRACTGLVTIDAASLGIAARSPSSSRNSSTAGTPNSRGSSKDSRLVDPFSELLGLVHFLQQCQDFVPPGSVRFARFQACLSQYMSRAEQRHIHSTSPTAAARASGRTVVNADDQEDFRDLLAEISPLLGGLICDEIVQNASCPLEQLYLICLAAKEAETSASTGLPGYCGASASSLARVGLVDRINRERAAQEETLEVGGGAAHHVEEDQYALAAAMLLPYLSDTGDVVQVLRQCDAKFVFPAVKRHLLMQLEQRGSSATVGAASNSDAFLVHAADVLRLEMRRREFRIAALDAFEQLYNPRGEQRSKSSALGARSASGSPSNLLSIPDLLSLTPDGGKRLAMILEHLGEQQRLSREEVQDFMAED